MVSKFSKLLQTLWGRRSVRAVELRIPYESDEQMAQVKDDLYQWRAQWQGSIQLSFRPCRRARMHHNNRYIPAKIVVVIASNTALNHLLEGLVITEQQLAPVWNLVAEVKDDTYQYRAAVSAGMESGRGSER